MLGPPGARRASVDRVAAVPLPGRRWGHPRRCQRRRGRCRERDGEARRVRVTRSPAFSVLRDTMSSSTETATRPRWCASLSRSPLGRGPSPQRELPRRPPGPADAAEAGVRTWHSGPRPCWWGLWGRRGGERAGLQASARPPPPSVRRSLGPPLSLVTGARGCCHRRRDGPARGHCL